MNRIIPATSSLQPGVDPTLKIYGAKALPTIRIRLKDSDDDRVLIVNQKDFDEKLYVRVE